MAVVIFSNEEILCEILKFLTDQEILNLKNVNKCYFNTIQREPFWDPLIVCKLKMNEFDFMERRKMTNLIMATLKIPSKVRLNSMLTKIGTKMVGLHRIVSNYPKGGLVAIYPEKIENDMILRFNEIQWDGTSLSDDMYFRYNYIDHELLLAHQHEFDHKLNFSDNDNLIKISNESDDSQIVLERIPNITTNTTNFVDSALFNCQGFFVAPYGSHGIELLHLSFHLSPPSPEMDDVTSTNSSMDCDVVRDNHDAMTIDTDSTSTSTSTSTGTTERYRHDTNKSTRTTSTNTDIYSPPNVLEEYSPIPYPRLQAYKITGDPNVPSGRHTFIINIETTYDPLIMNEADHRPLVNFPEDGTPNIFTLEDRLPHIISWYRGQGQINRTPRAPKYDWVDCNLLLYRQPLENGAYFSILWNDVDQVLRHIMDFKRPPGYNLSSMYPYLSTHTPLYHPHQEELSWKNVHLDDETEILCEHIVDALSAHRKQLLLTNPYQL